MKHAKHHHSSKYQININALKLTVTIKIPAMCRLWNIWAGLTDFPRHPGMRDDVPHSNGPRASSAAVQRTEVKQKCTKWLHPADVVHCCKLRKDQSQDKLCWPLKFKSKSRTVMPFHLYLRLLTSTANASPMLATAVWLDFCHFWELHPDKVHGTRKGVTTAWCELSLPRPTEFLFLGSLQILSERRESES